MDLEGIIICTGLALLYFLEKTEDRLEKTILRVGVSLGMSEEEALEMPSLIEKEGNSLKRKKGKKSLLIIVILAISLLGFFMYKAFSFS